MAELFRKKFFAWNQSEVNLDTFLKFPMFCFSMVFFDFKPLNCDATVAEKNQTSRQDEFLQILFILLRSR